MHVLPALALALLSSDNLTQPTGPVVPRESRFRTASPLPTLPPVTLDVEGNGVGLAQQTARAKDLQARIMWVDGTANLDAVNSTEKVTALVQKVKSAGFNTIVFDVKPIVGYTLYPSKLTTKLTKWKGQQLPLAFDPLAAMVSTCRAKGVALFASMNVFAEGHRYAITEPNARELFGSPGPGYERPDEQTVLYELDCRIGLWDDAESFPIAANTGDLPKDGKTIGVYVRGNVPNQLGAGQFGAVIDSSGLVLANVDSGKTNLSGIPEGGGLYVGVGNAATYLQQVARPGRRLTLRSVPKLVRISERPFQQIPLMTNPFVTTVWDRSLDFVQEIAKKYDVNGVVFDDRLRYGGINADFSEASRQAFERFVGQSVRWPEDVYSFVPGMDLSKGIKPGKWYDAWLAWRADKIKNFVGLARAVVRAARPSAQLGIYAGSWYGEYFRYGSNWGSPKLRAGFSFLSDQYRKTGFADEIDFLMTGAYYPIATIAEATLMNQPAGRTVESAGQLMNRCVRDETWAYTGIELMKFKGRPQALMNSLQAACGSSQGVMVFDYSHDFDQFLNIFKRAFSQPTKAPNMVPGLLESVRARRAQLDSEGAIDPPVTIREGAAGTGM